MYFHPVILHHNLRQIEVVYRISHKMTWSFLNCSKNMCKIHKARIRSFHQTYLLKVLKSQRCWIEFWWSPLLHDGIHIWSSSELLKHISNHEDSIINYKSIQYGFRFGPRIYNIGICCKRIKFGVYIFWQKMIFQHVSLYLI